MVSGRGYCSEHDFSMVSCFQLCFQLPPTNSHDQWLSIQLDRTISRMLLDVGPNSL